MAHSRFMQEVIALRKLRDAVGDYATSHLHEERIKPLLKPLNAAWRYKKV